MIKANTGQRVERCVCVCVLQNFLLSIPALLLAHYSRYIYNLSSACYLLVVRVFLGLTLYSKEFSRPTLVRDCNVGVESTVLLTVFIFKTWPLYSSLGSGSKKNAV